MTATVKRIVTAGSTNLQQLNTLADSPPKLKGWIIVNTAAYAIFVKFYWFKPTATAAAPTVGTTAPQITVQIPTVAMDAQSFTEGMIGGDGQLWIAVTKLAADSDTTAVVAGDGLLSILIDP